MDEVKKLTTQLGELSTKVEEWKEGKTGVNKKRIKCVVITDSNGREATADSIKRQMEEEERDGLDIVVVVAYTLEGALGMMQRREINLKEAVVVLDNLTNNVRTTNA
jgi:hypothetical protein